MATLREDAKAYEPKQTKNIADLSSVNADVQTEERTGKDKQKGTSYKYKVITLNGEDYRVPDSVLADLKLLLEENPHLESFKVKKSGSGFDTSYTVIPLTIK